MKFTQSGDPEFVPSYPFCRLYYYRSFHFYFERRSCWTWKLKSECSRSLARTVFLSLIVSILLFRKYKSCALDVITLLDYHLDFNWIVGLISDLLLDCAIVPKGLQKLLCVVLVVKLEMLNWFYVECLIDLTSSQ